MLISPGCIPCIVKQSFTFSQLLGVDDKNKQSQIIYDTIISLSENKEIKTAPHFSIKLQEILKNHLNGGSSFGRIKEKNLINAEKYIKYLGTMIKNASDKLELAIRISITGNSIDLGANPNYNLEQEINIITSELINLAALDKFREDFNKANRILFIADNYEEALFDKFLIKQLQPKEVVYAVRSNEILNDITLKDARNLGIDKLCKVIESGSRISGTDLNESTAEFSEIYKNADLIISKGQGNFETLLNSERSIYFLFKVKCEVISELCGFPVGTGVMLLNNRNVNR
ncbi:MAG TPA: ARMT1-like domain-containing protein [Ignavibacteriaceae bacterium]|nr:ARMT1-like domain-containing protein [Ignavibacteriaceae bacterium]